MERRRLVGVALVLASAFGFGSGALFAKPVYETGVDWHVLSAWRFGFGAILAWTWLLLLPDRRAALRRIGKREVLVALALGVLYSANSGSYYAGLETVPVSLAALLVYIYPVLVAVLALRFGRRLEGRRAWIALGMAVAGVILAVGGIDPSNVPPLDGLLLVVVSPVIYAAWIVLAARLSGERRGSRTASAEVGAAAATASALMITATATTWWVTALAAGREVLPGQIPTMAWPGLVGIGVLSTFVAIQGFYAGAQRVGAAQAALISTVEPLWTIGLAALLLGERLGPVQLAGGGLILAGVILAQTGRQGASRPSGGDDAQPARAASSAAVAPSMTNVPSDPIPRNR
ncbi:MAG TPA: DMT family transporter [Candidatus Limnocylindrales bacterium]|jgi:drug/metabolite transporter (DMT)-like permease